MAEEIIQKYENAFCLSAFSDDLKGPHGICSFVGKESEHIIVTDYTQDMIFVLTDRLRLERTFGSHGHDLGEYFSPCGVSTDGHDTVYIADKLYNRICVTDVSADETRVFGSRGPGADQLYHPVDLAVDSLGSLFIVDSGNNRIKVTDKDGSYIREFGSELFETEPMYISLYEGRDEIAVTDEDGAVYLFATDGRHLKTLTGLGDIIASGLQYDEHGNLLLCDVASGRVAVVTEGGEVATFIGDEDELWEPRDLTVTKNGDIVVCDFDNGRVVKYRI